MGWGFVGDLIGGLTGSGAANAAAGAQSAAIGEAINKQDKALGDIKDLQQPYIDIGTRNLGGLESLVTDPNAQLNYVQNNPFFSAMAGQAQNSLFNNAAARGKVGSGGTAEALQNSLLLLGNGLVDNAINRYSGLANMGQNAVNSTSGYIANNANQVSDLLTARGDAQAAGIVGARNANTGAFNSLLNFAGGGGTLGSIGTGIGSFLGLCDENFKDIIRKVGETTDGLPIYLFRYKGEDKLNVGVMAQDVEKVRPEAVHDIDGVKYIDMELAYGN